MPGLSKASEDGFGQTTLVFLDEKPYPIAGKALNIVLRPVPAVVIYEDQLKLREESLDLFEPVDQLGQVVALLINRNNHGERCENWLTSHGGGF